MMRFTCVQCMQKTLAGKAKDKNMKIKLLRTVFLSGSLLSSAISAAPIDLADTPIFVSNAVPPLNLLVMGKDHKLYYEAYPDNSDLNDDGVLDTEYKPDEIDYYGYFNSNVCYAHESGVFTPISLANNKKCSGYWGGDFLNYVGTSRMDALRKVLYGGYRSVDTKEKTILQAAYIPRDGHSWGKEYSQVRSGYSITDYTPLPEPEIGHYHLFAVATDINSSTQVTNQVPLLKTVTNTKFRIWDWVSKEAPVAGVDCWGGRCVSKYPANSWTEIPENVTSSLEMKIWAHDNTSSSPNQKQLTDWFNSPNKTFCGSVPVNELSVRMNSDGNRRTLNNNIFSGQADVPSACQKNQQFMVEITGKIKLVKSGTYKINGRTEGAGSMLLKIANQEVFSSFTSNQSVSLSAGEHNVSLRFAVGRNNRTANGAYWIPSWIPPYNNTGQGQSVMSLYSLNVEACPADKINLHDDNCQTYAGSGGDPVYKPAGLLHEFGADDRMYFGLLTGSYDKHLDGGVLRRNISSFKEEVDAQTGMFKPNVEGLVHNINSLKVYGFNGTGYEGCGLITTNPLDETSNQKCYMWGNPLAEMMYEGLRYFSGSTAATSNFNVNGNKTIDSKLGLSSEAWKAPYSKSDGYPVCARPVMTVVSDITPSYDYNVPGSKWNDTLSSDNKLAAVFDAQKLVDDIWKKEKSPSGKYFVGESGGTADSLPSPKQVNNLSSTRGLSPEEPSKKGTYYSAGVSHFGATHGINADAMTNNKMMTYSVALASPLPQIKFPVGANNFVTLVPFGKSVAEYNISTNGQFQPTLTIVDFYVQSMENMDPNNINPEVNGGRPYAQFRINYEDVEQGNDHDMDVIVLYTIYMNEQNNLVVQLDKDYEGAGIIMHMGYMISGTTKDGVYLEVRSKDNTNRYYKYNTPPGMDPGACIGANQNGPCKNLPTSTIRTFEPSGTAADLLPGPLWYAAKYGMPGRDIESIEGDPDNYFLVTNALTLKSQLSNAFNDIMQKNASVTRPAAGKAPIGAEVRQERSVYRTEFNAEEWTGQVIKETLDLKGNVSESVWVSSIPSTKFRAIKFNNDGVLGDFNWDNLDGKAYAGIDLQKTFSINEQGELDSNGSKRVDYILGDRSEEGKLFRVRKGLLGDIVNSNPVLVADAQYIPYLADKMHGTNNYQDFKNSIAERSAMVYVGANDGMLHGFDAETGEEKFAFIPTPVISKLHMLSQTSYGVNDPDPSKQGTHKFFVDGSLQTADVWNGNEWRTILVGALGAGGQGVFALDVTDPDNISLLWEFTADSAGAGGSLGYTFGDPQLIKLKDDQWVVALNNGYNSVNAASGNATLFLLDLNSGTVFKKIDAYTQAGNNGLSSLRIVDLNNDGVADYAYAGDMQGNLWRFDLANFKVSFDGNPLFKAGVGQPITAAPSLTRHPSGKGYLVMVGTGRYLANSDKVPPHAVQSVYGVWDEFTKKPGMPAVAYTKSDMLQQKFVHQTVADIGDDKQKITHEVRILTNNAPDWSKHKGWYLDLLEPNASKSNGERMVDEMAVRGKVMIFNTRRPSSDPCESGIEGWSYAINPATGGRADFNVFDLNKNFNIGSEDGLLYESRNTPISGFKAPPGGFTLAGEKMISSDGSAIDVTFRHIRHNRQNWMIFPID